MDKAIVKTDIQIAVPHGCYGRVGQCDMLIQTYNSGYTGLSLVGFTAHDTDFFISLSAPRSGLAAKNFIDVGGES